MLSIFARSLQVASRTDQRPPRQPDRWDAPRSWFREDLNAFDRSRPR